MKRSYFKILVVAYTLSAGVYFTSCKSKPKDTGNTADTTSMTAPAPVTPAPVEIAPDTALQAGVRDATKDYPGVKAEVNKGEITLTGEIKRSKLADLMMSLNSLKPKKINNQLTIK
ncbi:hypothetical protein [Segetibacter koreensis]|uniref:hypothetical protein n=1 Tax=Segetibacter koreensis TaxID=398037 RepID=UPI00036436E3|nr:hypothetical protein [Segetibacter koreensis]